MLHYIILKLVMNNFITDLHTHDEVISKIHERVVINNG